MTIASSNSSAEGGIISPGGTWGHFMAVFSNSPSRDAPRDKFSKSGGKCPLESVIPMCLQDFCEGALGESEGGITSLMPSQTRVPFTFFSEKPRVIPLSLTVLVKVVCVPASTPSASHHLSHASNSTFFSIWYVGPNSHSSSKKRSST